LKELWTNTMGDIIKNYEFGLDGVNIVVDPLKMSQREATQLQNAEIRQDADSAGAAALVMRGGLVALNGSALSGSILGGMGWPLKTTFTRTLYAALQTEDADQWKTSTDGTTWADVSSPAVAAVNTKYADETNERASRRMVSFRAFVLFAGNGYTQDTDDPIIVLWDGTTSVTVTSIKYGPSGDGNPPFAITDMLVADGKIFFAIHEPGGSAPHLCGRVLSLNLDTGVVKQIANGFGGVNPEVDGGAPSALAFYKGQLWVGLNTGNSTDGIGKIVRCYPDVDTTWTTDVSNLSQGISSLGVFKGMLFAGTYSSASTGARIYERSATAATWAARFTSGGGADGNGHIKPLHVFNGSLYAVEYHATAPTIHVKSSADGTTWNTDRDLDSSDSAAEGNFPGQMVTHNDMLFLVMRSTAVDQADGFIMERTTGGTWTKRSTDNYGGPIAVLVQRSE
jgi:hypothetical protein